MEQKNKTQKNEFLTFVQGILANSGLNLEIEDLSRRTIGSPDDFMRPILIEVVKTFQDKSGIVLLTADKQPLKWLPSNVTLGMLDMEFSEGCPEIALVREKLENAKKPRSAIKLDNLRESAAKKYAGYCGLVQDENFENRKVQQCFLKEIPGDWQSPIFDVEDDIIKKGATGTLQKDGAYIGWITPETTVAELLDVFQSCFGK